MKPCILNYRKPLTKLPDKLIYLRSVNTVMKPHQQEFVIFTPNSKNISGIMHCHKSKQQFREDYNGATLCIDFLSAIKREQGFGKSLINFAKNYSKQIGCNGYLCLMADGEFTPDKVPHVFYRKQGFTTLNEETDKKLDRLIRRKRDGQWNDFPNELMFYPSPSKNESFKEKFLAILDNLKSFF